MLFLLLNPVLFRVVLSLLVHLESFLAATANLLLPFVLELYTVLAWRHRRLERVVLHI